MKIIIYTQLNPFVQPHSFHLPNYVFLHFSLPIMCIAAWRSGHWVTLTPFTELPALHQHELSLFFLILLHKIWPAYSFHLPLNTLGNCIIKEWQWNNKTSTNPNNLKKIYEEPTRFYIRITCCIILTDHHTVMWLVLKPLIEYYFQLILPLWKLCLFQQNTILHKGKNPSTKERRGNCINGYTTTDNSTNNWKRG